MPQALGLFAKAPCCFVAGLGQQHPDFRAGRRGLLHIRDEEIHSMTQAFSLKHDFIYSAGLAGALRRAIQLSY